MTHNNRELLAPAMSLWAQVKPSAKHTTHKFYSLNNDWIQQIKLPPHTLKSQ